MIVLHSVVARFIYTLLTSHIIRSFFYRNFSHSYWLIGILLIYISFITLFSGYMVPSNLLSDSAYLIVSRIISSFPYFNLILLSTIIHFSFGIVTWSSKTVLTLHVFLASLITFLSVLHIFIIHLFGSNSLEKGNKPDNLRFNPFLTKWEAINTFFISDIIFLFVSGPEEVLRNLSSSTSSSDYLKGSSHLPNWFILILYVLIQSFSTVDPSLLYVSSYFVLIALFLLFTPFLYHVAFLGLLFIFLTWGLTLHLVSHGVGVVAAALYASLIFLIWIIQG